MTKETETVYPIPPQPNQVRLDTTTRCNAKCLSCHRFLTERKGEMTQDMILDILNDIKRWQLPLLEIVPVNYGEFFLRDDWAWILDQIAMKLPHTRITIPTNGSLLDGEKVSTLCDIPNVKLVNFSVNAYFEETYKAFMKLSYSTIEKIQKAIELIRIRRRDIIVWVSMVFDPAYHSDLERDGFIKFWQDKADKVWPLPAASAGRPTQVVEIVRSAPCRSLFSDIVVSYDGRLSSCCFDANFTIDCGNYTGDLKSDWRNPKLENLRCAHNEHRRAEIDLCRRCSYA